MFTNAYTSGYPDVVSYPYSSVVKPARPNISYDTSSKDPGMLRSRIFVGGLNTNKVSRDDVIQLFTSYGTILGVTIFKGYAFVQYSNLSEADLAVSALNLYHWHGSALGIILQESVASPPASTIGISNGGIVGKRPALNDPSNENTKKGRPQELQIQQQESAISSDDNNVIPDIFICGICRYITSNLENFVEHHGEPELFECASCDEKFITCWTLVEHWRNAHNLSICKKEEI